MKRRSAALALGLALTALAAGAKPRMNYNPKTELIARTRKLIAEFPFASLDACGRFFGVKIPPEPQGGSNEYFQVYEADTPGDPLIRHIELRANFSRQDRVQLLNIDLREPVDLGFDQLGAALGRKGVPMGPSVTHLPDRGAYGKFALTRGELRAGYTGLDMRRIQSLSIDVPSR